LNFETNAPETRKPGEMPKGRIGRMIPEEPMEQREEPGVARTPRTRTGLEEPGYSSPLESIGGKRWEIKNPEK